MKCKRKLPSAKARTPPIYGKREKDDTTVGMPYLDGWFAANAAAAINESPGIFTVAKRWFVESIKVKSRNEIEIQFVGGYKEKKMLN